jgi:hypothetical protein
MLLEFKTMSTMITEVYTAIKELGVSEDKAVKAAEAISNVQTATKSDIAEVRHDMYRAEKELFLLRWMLGFNLAFTAAILWRVFFGA